MPHPIHHLDLQNISRIQPHPPPCLPLSSGRSQMYHDGGRAMAGPGRAGPRRTDGWKAQTPPWSVMDETQHPAWPTSAGNAWGRAGPHLSWTPPSALTPAAGVILQATALFCPRHWGIEARVLTVTCRVSSPPRSLPSSHIGLPIIP